MPELTGIEALHLFSRWSDGDLLHRAPPTRSPPSTSARSLFPADEAARLRRALERAREHGRGGGFVTSWCASRTPPARRRRWFTGATDATRRVLGPARGDPGRPRRRAGHGLHPRWKVPERAVAARAGEPPQRRSLRARPPPRAGQPGARAAPGADRGGRLHRAHHRRPRRRGLAPGRPRPAQGWITPLRVGGQGQPPRPPLRRTGAAEPVVTKPFAAFKGAAALDSMAQSDWPGGRSASAATARSRFVVQRLSPSDDGTATTDAQRRRASGRRSGYGADAGGADERRRASPVLGMGAPPSA